MAITIVTWVAVCAVALFVGWPLVQARVGREPGDPDIVSPLERQKRDALAAIKEAEFDRRMGKLSEEDFASLTGRYRTQAMAAIAGLGAARAGRPGTSAAKEPAYCWACGAKRAAQAKFCASCGKPVRRAA
jgi:rRNA maturation endonuclease Nob1